MIFLCASIVKKGIKIVLPGSSETTLEETNISGKGVACSLFENLLCFCTRSTAWSSSLYRCRVVHNVVGHLRWVGLSSVWQAFLGMSYWSDQDIPGRDTVNSLVDAMQIIVVEHFF